MTTRGYDDLRRRVRDVDVPRMGDGRECEKRVHKCFCSTSLSPRTNFIMMCSHPSPSPPHKKSRAARANRNSAHRRRACVASSCAAFATAAAAMAASAYDCLFGAVPAASGSRASANTAANTAGSAPAPAPSPPTSSPAFRRARAPAAPSPAQTGVRRPHILFCGVGSLPLTLASEHHFSCACAYASPYAIGASSRVTARPLSMSASAKVSTLLPLL